MFKRLLALTHARNLEFLRDRSSLGWNVIMPFFLVLGLAMVFSDGNKPMYKVALVQAETTVDVTQHPFLQTRYVDFYTIAQADDAIDKVARHQVDLLLDLTQQRYWVNPKSPNGYMVEKLLLATDERLQAQVTANTPISYVDWVVPGILGMNIMFSCLFGVGFVIVRYRKSGYLKRLNATPLSPFEFITAQLLSRLLLIVGVSVFIFVASKWFIGFAMNGNYWDLLWVSTLGAMALISMSLLTTARVSSEELAGGLLNLLTWPMMLLSGVWFSLEGSAQWIQWIAQLLPLTHLLTAAREIMIDGARLGELGYEVAMLSAMTVMFLLLGSSLFKWNPH